ncbi:type II toxin-antitoxin system Phd/YefM family antitoxin [Actimicrobium sp. CCC2.4]|uniref:type II toxin-antitoxin system Phd/YefM family antitoxin n=1 Tax=Actimicrobium sp. CCC2.4 TaxID=3048606 RepID=UPI002AC8CC32|nr:type II toxin-antitoxin system Phd/YefM family antitoxin [Actimicrobium sp. CCC2.4]MEB0134943.1 type II toxin-antitoxin system Phd/YefM family antitoxin [Actimicrobium sp. CCC2.4]WPX32006.1 type II toxin-antitoxin system Phd/YefM family antitoxin [Actimicrobium sp. CCC2.4]
MKSWKMQQAKEHMSEVVQRARDDGPQEITMRGRSVAVVISREMYDQLSGKNESLADFIRNSPLFGTEEIEFERDRSPTRDVAL